MAVSTLLATLFLIWLISQLTTGMSFRWNIIDHLFHVFLVATMTAWVHVLGHKTKLYNKYIYATVILPLVLILYWSISFKKRQLIGVGFSDKNLSLNGGHKLRVDWFMAGWQDQGTLAIVYHRRGLFEMPVYYYQESLYGVGEYITEARLNQEQDTLKLRFAEEHYSESYGLVPLKRIDF